MKAQLQLGGTRLISVLLPLFMLFSTDVFADTIHARVSSGGLILQLTPVSPGGSTGLEEMQRVWQSDGNIYSDRLRAHGFTYSELGNPFPVEHELVVEDGVNKATLFDRTGRGFVELGLAPVSYRDRNWTARSTTTEFYTLMLSPSTILTATLYLEGQLWLTEPEQHRYSADGVVKMTAYSESEVQSTQFRISSGQVGFPVSEAEYIQLVIGNLTDEPMRIFIETMSEVTASWTPSIVSSVPEPDTWALLLFGFLSIAAFGRSSHSSRQAASYINIFASENSRSERIAVDSQ